MTLDQILLLGSIIVPALSSALLFAGIGGGDYWAKKLAYIGFGFPFIANFIKPFFNLLNEIIPASAFLKDLFLLIINEYAST